MVAVHVLVLAAVVAAFIAISCNVCCSHALSTSTSSPFYAPTSTITTNKVDLTYRYSHRAELDYPNIDASPAASAMNCSISLTELNSLDFLYNSTNGKNWHTNNSLGQVPWSFPANVNDPCAGPWLGVACDYMPSSSSNCYVKSLFLRNRGLNGSIPAQIGDLWGLSNLSLNKNFIFNSLPSEISKLTRLESLLISENSVSGRIPLQISALTNLVELSLWSNQLGRGLLDKGAGIPSEISALTLLEDLDLFQNELKFPIPTQISRLTKLRRLVLGSNYFNGTIENIATLVGLDSVYLGGNCFTGTISSGLFNLTKLRILGLEFNSLTGKKNKGFTFDINNALREPPKPLFASQHCIYFIRFCLFNLQGRYQKKYQKFPK